MQLPFPQFTSITVAQNSGFSRYNALAVKVQKRMASGLTVLSTYTWSANWDNLWGAGSQVYSTYGPQDAFNPKAERSRALNNVPNRFTAAFSYDLPFGRGKMFGGHVNRWVDEAIGGWQINDEWTLQNGVPLSVIQTNLNLSQGTTGFGGSYQRPNLVGDAHAACLTGRPQGRLGVTSYATAQQAYVNTAAFSPAPAYTYGNAPRNLPCQQPGSNNSDVSINKSFKITERVNAQFRAEALNAFNTPQFGNPSATYVVNTPATIATPPTAATGASQTLGNVTTQINYNRIIQLGAESLSKLPGQHNEIGPNSGPISLCPPTLFLKSMVLTHRPCASAYPNSRTVHRFRSGRTDSPTWSRTDRHGCKEIEQ